MRLLGRLLRFALPGTELGRRSILLSKYILTDNDSDIEAFRPGGVSIVTGELLANAGWPRGKCLEKDLSI